VPFGGTLPLLFVFADWFSLGDSGTLYENVVTFAVGEKTTFFRAGSTFGLRLSPMPNHCLLRLV
jgi:hypothetical protein